MGANFRGSRVATLQLKPSGRTALSQTRIPRKPPAALLSAPRHVFSQSAPPNYAVCLRARAAETLRLMNKAIRPIATTPTMQKTTTTPASCLAQFSRLAMWETASRERRAVLMAGMLAFGFCEIGRIGPVNFNC